MNDQGEVLPALIKNLERRNREETGVPVNVADESLASVEVRTGQMLSYHALRRKISIH